MRLLPLLLLLTAAPRTPAEAVAEQLSGKGAARWLKCYQRVNQQLAPSLWVRFAIAPNGEVSDAGVSPERWPAPDPQTQPAAAQLHRQTADCVLQFLRSTRFRLPPDAGAVEVHYPFSVDSVGL